MSSDLERPQTRALRVSEIFSPNPTHKFQFLTRSDPTRTATTRPDPTRGYTVTSAVRVCCDVRRTS